MLNKSVSILASQAVSFFGSLETDVLVRIHKEND